MHKSLIHKDVLKLPKSATFNANEVLSWLKHNQEQLPELRRQARKTPRVEGAIARLADIEGYIRMLTRYLRHGDWCSDFYGKDQEFKMKWKRSA